MLSPKIKKAIQSSYQNLSHQLDGFVPRRAQNYLVSEIAKTLSGEYHKKDRIILAEAGTGIGKSLAYLMACVPFAQFSQKKIVIATATVALQEQLLQKDMPLYRRLTEVPFSFAMAKGRQRYCCAEKLSLLSTEHPLETETEDSDTTTNVQQEMFAGQAGFSSKPSKKDVDLVNRLFKALSENKWNGDRDNWSETIPDMVWQAIASDKHACNNSMPSHRYCPFQKARADLDKVDVIITNHSLVMADLELGGGIILPEPENTIYIFDEAHHLPHIARDNSAAFASLKGSIIWLEGINKQQKKWIALTDVQRSRRFQNELIDSIQQIIPALTQLLPLISLDSFKDDVYRFPNGTLPDWLVSSSKDLKDLTHKANLALAKIIELIAERVKDGQVATRLAEPALAEAGFYQQRLENLNKLWQLMSEQPSPKSTPLARWLSLPREKQGNSFNKSETKLENRQDKGDYFVHASPLEIGDYLEQKLWSRCYGAVLVSATLRALNSFDYFARDAGISLSSNKSTSDKSGTQTLALASPFDYQTQGELLIPKLDMDPSAPDFTDYLIKKIPDFIEENKSNLILFSSYWQMNKVSEGLEKLAKKKKWQLQVQGQESRQELLKKHRAYCQLEKTSVLMGTGSFSEGLDLPGKLLENLIITKIPFAVPTSPIEEAYAEYVTQSGGNPFMQLSVPEASKKLIQSVGRLLRKEQDTGRIVLLDRRIITKRYGSALLDSLPPFKRTIEK